MILDHNKIIIFGHPRSGTKLIANILESFGYSNFREWHNVFTHEIKDLSAHRYDPDKQKQMVIDENLRPNFEKAKRTMALIERNNLMPKQDKFVTTIWEQNLSEFPFLPLVYSDCLWICPRRKNWWDQLLSMMLVYYNKNQGGEFESSPITIEGHMFHRRFWLLHRVHILQDWLIKNYNSPCIKFEELISGTSKEFGKPYTVSSVDQHADLESLILNLHEVRNWYNNLVIERRDMVSLVNLL